MTEENTYNAKTYTSGNWNRIAHDLVGGVHEICPLCFMRQKETMTSLLVNMVLTIKVSLNDIITDCIRSCLSHDHKVSIN